MQYAGKELFSDLNTKLKVRTFWGVPHCVAKQIHFCTAFAKQWLWSSPGLPGSILHLVTSEAELRDFSLCLSLATGYPQRHRRKSGVEEWYEQKDQKVFYARIHTRPNSSTVAYRCWHWMSIAGIDVWLIEGSFKSFGNCMLPVYPVSVSSFGWYVRVCLFIFLMSWCSLIWTLSNLNKNHWIWFNPQLVGSFSLRPGRLAIGVQARNSDVLWELHGLASDFVFEDSVFHGEDWKNERRSPREKNQGRCPMKGKDM